MGWHRLPDGSSTIVTPLLLGRLASAIGSFGTLLDEHEIDRVALDGSYEYNRIVATVRQTM